MWIQAFELLGGSRGLNDTIRALSLFSRHVLTPLFFCLPAHFRTETLLFPLPHPAIRNQTYSVLNTQILNKRKILSSPVSGRVSNGLCLVTCLSLDHNCVQEDEILYTPLESPTHLRNAEDVSESSTR